MDRFTKVVLAVIAVALCAIAAKLWQFPSEAHAQGFLSSGPTVGDFQDAKDADARARLFRRVPVVRVQGGVVSIN